MNVWQYLGLGVALSLVAAGAVALIFLLFVVPRAHHIQRPPRVIRVTPPRAPMPLAVAPSWAREGAA
jgi:hypothetical protein